MNPYVLIVLGFGCLALGGELLVRGASGLAKRLGFSELIIGLTVVAFATSAPELAVSVNAAYFGHADVAFGNVVGSNIFNILFVLGLSALAAPLMVDRQLLYRDVPIMIALSLLTYWIARNGVIEHHEAVVLLVLLLGYTALSAVTGRQTNRIAMEIPDCPSEDAKPQSQTSCPRCSLFLVVRNLAVFLGLSVVVCVGVGVLVLGAKLFVDGAVSLANAWGISELVIAVTIVAAGTSLPEAATSIVAGLKGHRDIAIGNVVGSNIFNILCVLGFGTLVTRNGMNVAEDALSSDLPIMVGVAVICLPIFFTGQMVGRLEGLLLFGYYLAYTANLTLAVTHSPYLSVFRQTMLWGIIPLTVLLLLIRMLQHVLRRQRR
jgi:cation:H+ antiporter